mgnify:CR=1 FL=1
MGGSIRHSSEKPVKIDRRHSSFTKALYDDYTPDLEDDDYYDHESALYSHFGGKISGKGARHDPPEVVRFLHHTFKQYPKVLAAYHSGRVVNAPMHRR